MSAEEPGTLELGEVHPATHIAAEYIDAQIDKHPFIQEALASCALSDNRIAEVCSETLRRWLNKEPMSDRYLMGLAWMLWSMEQQSTNWISVKDRLPEEEAYYLCMVKGHGVRIRRFSEWAKDTRKRFWSNGSETKKVTHWMPLPEPPEITEKCLNILKKW